jgi:hypothetical protein
MAVLLVGTVNRPATWSGGTLSPAPWNIKPSPPPEPGNRGKRPGFVFDFAVAGRGEKQDGVAGNAVNRYVTLGISKPIKFYVTGTRRNSGENRDCDRNSVPGMPGIISACFAQSAFTAQWVDRATYFGSKIQKPVDVLGSIVLGHEARHELTQLSSL